MTSRLMKLATSLVCACAVVLLLTGAATARRSEIAITFDDLPVNMLAPAPLARQQQVTHDLVRALKARKLPIVAFVNTSKLLDNGALDPRRVALLEEWLDAGFELGNHTATHPSLNRLGPAEFEKDVIAGETPLRDIIKRHRSQLRYFRHPMLHTGRSPEIRRRIEAFLAGRGYTVAPVTIDNSEWIFARAYDEAFVANDDAARTRVVAAYLDYMVAKVEYYETQSTRLFGRDIRHVLLVHSNALNAAAFGTLADRLKKRGNRFITLARALEDRAYKSPDEYYGAGGISWLDRWALTRKVPKDFFAAEPRTPEWVQTLAKIQE